MTRASSAAFSLRIFFTLGILFLASQQFQQTNPTNVYDDIDTFVQQSLSANRIPGLQLGIVQYGKVLYLQAYGEAERGRDLQATTPMFIGGLTQTFTSLAVLQLIEAGKIDLDAPVQTYLPDFQVSGAVSRPITVHDLLNQTSGLSDLADRARLGSSASLEERVRSLRAVRQTAAPGVRFQDFSPNYTALGLIVEKVSGMSYDEYMRRNILSPLQMKHTYTSVAPALTAGLAQGYTAVLGYPVARRQPVQAYNLPASGLISNAGDLTRFMIVQLAGGKYAHTQLVSPAAIQTMQTPDPDSGSVYGMGWYEQSSSYGKMIYSTGSLDNFSSIIELYPAHRFGVVVLINQNHLLYNGVEYAAIRAGIVDIFFQQKPPPAISMSFLYQIIAVLLILDIVLEMRAFARIPLSAQRLEAMPRNRRRWLLGINFGAPLFILFLLPPIIQGVTVRPFSWRILFNQLPVLVFWLFFAMVMVLGRGVARLWLLYREEIGQLTR